MDSFLEASPGAVLEAENFDELDLRGNDEGERQRRRTGITQVDIQPTEARPPQVSFEINFTLTTANVFPELEALPLGVRPCVCEASQPPSQGFPERETCHEIPFWPSQQLAAVQSLETDPGFPRHSGFFAR